MAFIIIIYSQMWKHSHTTIYGKYSNILLNCWQYFKDNNILGLIK